MSSTVLEFCWTKFHLKPDLKLRNEIIDCFIKNLGWAGRMVTRSKLDYASKYPNHCIVFNANVVLGGFGKVWHGDVDLTVDEPALKTIALRFGTSLYVLREMDARHDTEHSPRLERYIYLTDGVLFKLGEDGYYQRIRGKIIVAKGRRGYAWG